MAIRHTTVENAAHRGIVFQESKLAREFCHDEGIEIGAAAHNPFNLPGAINVAPADDFEFYKNNQVGMCGAFAEIDIEAEAHDIPLPPRSQGYVLSSHVIEHLPDPIAAFMEWDRLLVHGGVVFMIIPKRDALDTDVGRPISRVSDLVAAHREGWTVDTVPAEVEAEAGGRRGHYWVFDLETMRLLVEMMNVIYGTGWRLLIERETDDKVGNGHLLIFEVNHVDPPTNFYGESIVGALKNLLSEETQAVDEALAEEEPTQAELYAALNGVATGSIAKDIEAVKAELAGTMTIGDQEYPIQSAEFVEEAKPAPARKSKKS